ncbi:polysaccharide deacetylase family protein [Planktothrix sp. FACHB-1365]|uniref:polysaccharide deacetylase family protein n=1 Tax=Planktothrix sp. FACHB-1365 TaxID=2692855 RepID=UPI0016883A6B|nr:polysaccharide deacetylase family protein [Planktothrix sp. FACHB-1365]MBD2485778.1 polysaccharide deacetylase family protein [Planktothrix sp. FACHB-1365]
MSKGFYQCFIYISSSLILWGCGSSVNVEVSPTPKPPELIQEKPVNGLGGYFYSNGENAFGPFTQRMVQKCQGLNGGSVCNTQQWPEALFLKAYGQERCPDGSRFNQILGYCVEGNEALGPFPKELIPTCDNANDSSTCVSTRQNARLLYKMMQDKKLITPVGRPPQFVLLAFDGSRSLDAWKKSRNFTQSMSKKNIKAHFTYFISGVYFVNNEKRNLYTPPGGKGRGRSAIGWGGTPAEINLRLEQLNKAYQEGHEIGSHAVGHFDGSRWSEADWTREFDYFNQFIFNAYKINNLKGSLVFDVSEIQGFRAPELGQSPGLYKTLKKRGFRYDTSRVAAANYWPKLENGVWNFPLASVTTAMTRKNVLSMDYNFYYLHSKAKPNSSNAKRYEEDMFQTYLKYFQSNYLGNRAPVHIGHHFSDWNQGAYWKALFRFAEAVCGQPEVRCVTYSVLADFMDLQTPEQIAIYQKGGFPKPNQETMN